MMKLLIDYKSNFIRIALLKNFRLHELIIENKNNQSIVSNIYIGIVKNIIKKQFAFIDIGEEKNVFLQLNDSKNSSIYSINEKGKKILNLQLGKEIIIQVLKDGTNTKGATATTEISFIGNSIVLLANTPNKVIGVSKKIMNEEKRSELKSIALELLPKNFGIIMRTKSQNYSRDEIKKELEDLINLANNTLEKGKHIKGPYILTKDISIGEVGIKELLQNNIDEIIINDEAHLKNLKKILDDKLPNSNIPIRLHDDNMLLFSQHNIESVIKKLLHKKIWLKSGGFLIIEETEACVVIDVNTGKSVKIKDQRKSFLSTNLEAAIEITNQIKLRNLSGMIIIDFISMNYQEDINMLKETLSKEFLKDRISTTIVGITELGLMQLTRKKTRESLKNILQKQCSCCNGTGFSRNTDYIIHRIYKEILYKSKNTNFKNFVITGHCNIINNDDFKNLLDELEKEFTITISTKESKSTQEDYFSIDNKHSTTIA